MPDSLLKALKLFVIIGGIVIVGGTATLIWVVVKRGTTAPVSVAAALPGTIELPPGGEVAQMAVTGSRLLLLGRAPNLGQFVLEVDLATGARRQLLRLAPAAP